MAKSLEAPDHEKDGLLVGDETESHGQNTCNHAVLNASKSPAKKDATKKKTSRERIKQSKKVTKKQKWTYKEKLAVATAFRSYMTSHSHVKTLPGKAEIETALSTTPCLSSRTWRNVKDYIRNNQYKAY
nr:uncharacterized protein LOC129275603 [Lytechinus pictus]